MYSANIVAVSSTAGTAPRVSASARPRFRVLRALVGEALPTAKYLTATEVHTYAFSVAANAILSFFPFMVLLMTLVLRVFHSHRMYEVLVQLLRDYLPTGQEFVIRNLRALVDARSGVQVFSAIMLVVTSTGVFLPLEVALNRVWGFSRNRSYLRNQVISLALAVSCGGLALLSVASTAATNRQLLTLVRGGGTLAGMNDLLTFMVMKLFAVLATVAIFFLIYWLLPNGKVKARRVLPAAIVVGLLWEGAKYLYIIALPWLNFSEAYGPFSISVTLMFWAFLSGLLLLAGARLSAAVIAGSE